MTAVFEITGVVITALVTALTHLASNTGLPTKWCPWLALLLGVAGGFVLSGFNVSAVIYGLVIGLSSYGLWNGALDATGKQV